MTDAAFPGQDFKQKESSELKRSNTEDSRRRESSELKRLDAEVIRAVTPIFIAAIGGVIGIAVIVTNANAAGFGLASTAIAGAAGLAQPNKDQKQKDG